VKVLLDEDIPVKLRESLTAHEVVTVAFLKWKGVRNGNLMRRAESDGFDVLVTRDVGLGHQRPRDVERLAIIHVRLGRGRINDLLPHLALIQAAIDNSTPGSTTRVSE